MYMLSESEAEITAQAPVSTPRAAVEEEKRAKVLVIEDEVGLRRLLRFCLERSGYEVTEADTGDKGLDATSRCLPDAGRRCGRTTTATAPPICPTSPAGTAPATPAWSIRMATFG